eukprot:8026577-Karenia_brevis.AAC.1
MEKAVAQEMVERASQLSNEAVEVEAPKEAREQVAAARSKSAASSSKESSGARRSEPALPSARKVSHSSPPEEAMSDKTEGATVGERNWGTHEKQSWDTIKDESSAASEANYDETDAVLASGVARLGHQ